jgi:hypothetical protein
MTSISDQAAECGLLNAHSELSNSIVLNADPYSITYDMHKSLHPHCAQPHVKLVSV